MCFAENIFLPAFIRGAKLLVTTNKTKHFFIKWRNDNIYEQAELFKTMLLVFEIYLQP
jgi:hypothetical protein